MELKISSPKPVGLSPSDCANDPEEKEFSDDDDDDRNHKHRRQETRSQSSDRDAMEQAFSRPFRKRNKPYENGHPFRDSDSQSSESWKNFNGAPSEKDFSKFDRRRPGFSTFARAPLDLNQRIRVPQSFFGDSAPGRGRGRDSWSQCDFRFSSVDAASQVVHQGSFPSLFSGRGFPNASNAHNASWNGFGLIPGVPNGGLDALHSLGLQGSLRQPINPSLNMGIPRQRCRDFEERGFCLRGDMCPMEHGVNRIVVEDVQSLSQFNLPVSLPSAHLLGTPAGPGSTTSVTAPSSTVMNSRGLLSKSSKPEMAEDDGLGLNCPFSGPGGAGGADLYDPDQPLWNNGCPEASSPLLALNSSKIDESGSLLDGDPSDRLHVEFGDTTDIERPVRSTGTAVGSQSTSSSIWRRIGSSKNRSEGKEESDSIVNLSDQLADDIAQGTVHQGKRATTEDIAFKAMNSSNKTQSDHVRNTRKPSQKALRTLFVNGIPQKNNRREALLLHFRKFGEVIDIYIPLNSERAFVQFSRREEAEAALKAPDAVMGNRFIKLWWANRDSIHDDGTGSGNSVSLSPRGMTAASVLPNPPVASQGKDNVRSVPSKVSITNASDVPKPADLPKPVITSDPTAPPPLQKKLENLELLKEELRRKQEMLDQKRNDFRRRLHKLEKQSSGPKSEEAIEQAVKRHKSGIIADVAKATTPRLSDPGIAVASPIAERVAEKNKSVDNVVSHSSNTTSAMVLQEPTSLKQPIRPLAPVMTHFLMNRFKLDNRPTTFRIIPPLPAGLANVAILKEHFSLFGDLSNVELEDLEETHNDSNGSEIFKNCSARVTFTSRPSAEKAFKNGKCWQDHNLQFMWLPSINSSNDGAGKENSLSGPKKPIDANVRPGESIACNVSPARVVAENGNSDDLERNKSCVDHIEPDKDIQPSLTNILCEKESP